MWRIPRSFEYHHAVLSSPPSKEMLDDHDPSHFRSYHSALLLGLVGFAWKGIVKNAWRISAPKSRSGGFRAKSFPGPLSLLPLAKFLLWSMGCYILIPQLRSLWLSRMHFWAPWCHSPFQCVARPLCLLHLSRVTWIVAWRRSLANVTCFHCANSFDHSWVSSGLLVVQLLRSAVLPLCLLPLSQLWLSFVQCIHPSCFRERAKDSNSWWREKTAVRASPVKHFNVQEPTSSIL